MKILLIVTRQIGDVLLTTPLVRRARERWPEARIDVLGFAGTLGMLRGNTDIDALIETPHRLGIGGFLRLVLSIRRRYDLALIAESSDRAHLIGWIAARRRMGVVPARSSSNWWKKALLARAVQSAGDRGDVHVASEKLSIVDAETSDPAPPAVVPPPAAALAPQLQAQLRPGAVVLHVPSMWAYKQWPVASYREVAAALLAEGRQVVLTGTGAARDQESIRPLLDLAPSPQLLDVSGVLDLNQVSCLVGQAALYIGPDTSVTHLAAATGTATIAIFGPTDPVRWGPWPGTARSRAIFERSALVQTAGNVTLLQGGLPCVPCGRAGCEDHLQSRSDCLAAITPQRVLEQARRLLQERAGC